MSAEAQQLLERVKKVRNVAVEGQVVDKATRFMTHQEKESKIGDLEYIEGVLSPANNIPGHVVLDQDARKNLVNYKRALQKDIAENMAPDKIPGDAKDVLKARRDVLVEKIKEGMPPHEVMRRNPTGAVSQHLKWMDATRDFQLEYKNIQRLLEPQDSSEDLANIEMLRPSIAGPKGDAATYMADSWTPGVFAMSAQAKENWPLGEPKVDTPLAQAERRELEELRAKLNDPRTQKALETYENMTAGMKKRDAKALKRSMSQFQRDIASQRMKDRWAAKKAAQQSSVAEPGEGLDGQDKE